MFHLVSPKERHCIDLVREEKESHCLPEATLGRSIAAADGILPTAFGCSENLPVGSTGS